MITNIVCGGVVWCGDQCMGSIWMCMSVLCSIEYYV